MARRSIATLIFPLALACLASTPNILAQSGRKPGPPAPAAATRSEVRVPFRSGEMLTYDVSYSKYVTAGAVTLHVQAKRPSYNAVAYYIVAEARPAPLVSKIYTLYYKADVLMDVYTLLPQRAGVYSEEGQRHQMKVTMFDDPARKASFENTTAKSGKREFSVPALTQDALSAIYVLRALPLKIGFRETIPVTAGGHVYRAQVSADASETVATPAGSFNTFRVRTSIAEDGHAVDRPITIWITDTPSRVPVKVQSDLQMGSFVLMLNQARLGQ